MNQDTIQRVSRIIADYREIPIAASQAFESAGLDRTDRPRGGIFLGTGFGGQGASEETYRSAFSPPPGPIPRKRAARSVRNG